MFYKATRPDGTDFYSGTQDYAAALASGEVMNHPVKFDGRRNSDHAVNYFSVSTVPTDCTGMSWPCRLFEVEPVSRVWTPDAKDLPNKRATRSLRVVRELNAVDALGPQGAQLVDLIGQAAKLTEPQADQLVAAWVATRDVTRDVAWDATRVATRVATRDAAWDAARDAARDAAWALSVRDLISTDGFTQAHYDLLIRPWVSVMGRVHPDDQEA